jgi:putative glutamine amidotransferase
MSVSLHSKHRDTGKPVILICGAPAFDRQFRSSAIVLNKTYPQAITSAGGIPLLPAYTAADEDTAEAYAAWADGLVLTGSNSYAPTMELMQKIETEELPARDAFDEAMYRGFKKAGKPILGICLGHQVMNLFEGGTLIENFKLTDGVEHAMIQHSVNAVEGTLVYRLFGSSFVINSRHNNRIGELAPTLKATAFSPDGVIEAVEHTGAPIWGVQWHPERMRGDIPDPPEGANMDPLFEFFVRQC